VWQHRGNVHVALILSFGPTRKFRTFALRLDRRATEAKFSKAASSNRKQISNNGRKSKIQMEFPSSTQLSISDSGLFALSSL